MITIFPITDEVARRAIIEELDKNIFVLAGAGSGKTTMLVNRMVSLVESGKAKIEEICAITFTVNAAAEFLERLRNTLKRRSEGKYDPLKDGRAGGLGQITPAIMQRDKEALRDIDLCFAGTMDSFCNLILSEYPIEADIPSSSAVLDESEEEQVYKKEYVRLAEKYQNHDSFKAFVRLMKDPATTFARTIKPMIDSSYLKVQYTPPTQTLDSFIASFKARYETVIKNDLNDFKLHKLMLVKPNQDATKGINKFNSIFPRVFGSDWGIDEILALDTILDGLKKLKFSADPALSGTITYVKDKTLYIFDENCAFAQAVKEAIQTKHSFVIDFLYMCAKEVRNKLKSEGRLTFSEYLYIFKTLVQDDLNNNPNKPLITHIRNRYKYFLLDESQDTSPFQYELFLYLCSTVPANDIFNVQLDKASIFIVGDPKQSIYRFRSADITSYQRVEALFNEPDPNVDYDNIKLELTNNYRSNKTLCEFFNQQYASMPNYKPIANASSKPSTPNQGLYTFDNFVDVIKTIVENPNYQIDVFKEKIVDGEIVTTNTPRRIAFEDIMILTKSKKSLSTIVKALEDANIPCYSEDDNRLGDYKISEVAYAVYCYLASNKDQYFYNLLTCPLFGLSKKEALSVNEKTLSKDQKLLLDNINRLRGIKNPVLLFEAIIKDLDIFNYIPSSRIDYVYYILNKMNKAYSGNAVVTLEDGISFLGDLIVSPQERIAMLTYKPNAVRIDNVHKVKGLESPVVMILKAGKSSAGENGVMRHMDYGTKESYIFRIGKYEYRRVTYYDSENTYDYKPFITLEAQESDKENDRLHYVAATRASSYLFVENSDSHHKEWEDFSLSSAFVPFVVSQPQIDLFDKRDSTVTNIYDANPIQTHFKKDTSYNVVLPSKLTINHDGIGEETQIDSQATNDAAEKGTLVHALMEIYATSNFAYSNSDVVEETLSRYGQSSNDQYRQMLTDVINTMTSGGYPQSSGQKEDLISILKTASEIYCEVPFSYQEGNNIYNGSIDLLYKLGDKYYIVDYKTNYDGTDLDNKYEKQLEAYQKAIKDIEGIDTTARIYHIDIK